MKKKIVLAYSGGLDTSILLKWIQEKYNAEIITVTLDVGQQSNLLEIEEKAKKMGALKHYSLDMKKKFSEDYIFPAIKANALYQGKYPVSTALSRPLIAEKLVEIAQSNKATAIAHGCTGKGNDQVRIEITIRSLAPELEIIAPVREWRMTRDYEIEFAKKHDIPIPVQPEKPYSIDENLWGRSIECGVLENPNVEPPEHIFNWTRSSNASLNENEYLSINFEFGEPESLDGKRMKPVELIRAANEIAGKYGIGRIDHIEDRLIGIKSREMYECPAATIIIEAHKDLEQLVLTKHELMFKQQVDILWGNLVYNGLWKDPLKNDLDAFINKTQERLCGDVRLKFFKGGYRIVGRSSPYSLYDASLATYNMDTTFDQTLSAGFIQLWGLPTQVANVLLKRIKVKEHV